jgi:hypothetical protein
MRTFIVRFHEDTTADAARGRMRGVVDEVATGRRVTFRCSEELLTALAAALTADVSAGPAKPSDLT